MVIFAFAYGAFVGCVVPNAVVNGGAGVVPFTVWRATVSD
jgi:hypothetical protein